jgi:hypothetical protein
MESSKANRRVRINELRLHRVDRRGDIYDRKSASELFCLLGRVTSNSELIHNPEPIWEGSLDSLRNQAISLRTRSMSAMAIFTNNQAVDAVRPRT